MDRSTIIAGRRLRSPDIVVLATVGGAGYGLTNFSGVNAAARQLYTDFNKVKSASGSHMRLDDSRKTIRARQTTPMLRSLAARQ